MNLKDSAKDLLGLKTDSFKLGLVENLSVVLNQFLGTFVLIIMGLIALVFVAAGVNKWLGTAIGSETWAFFITGGFFLLLFFVLFICRKKLFVNSFVTLFSKMFFEERDANAVEE